MTRLGSLHVSRTLQALRAENLITLKSGHVVILDQDRLFEFSGFNPNYLHLSTGAAANRIRTSLADTPRAPGAKQRSSH